MVAFGRVIPLVRSLISIPAGANRMNLGRFVLYTTLGSAAWNSVVLTIGWLLGQRWEAARRWADLLTVLVVLAFASYLGRTSWRRRRADKASRTAGALLTELER